MGIAAIARKLAVGTKNRVQEYFNIPGLCRRLAAPELGATIHDAC